MQRIAALLVLLFGINVFAGEANPAAAPAKGGAELTFAVITEFPGGGRKLPPPTAENPAYVLLQSGKQHDYGEGHAGQKSPPENLVEQAIAAVAPQGRAPKILLTFIWGSHGSSEAGTQDAGLRNLLDRAALVGGVKFKEDLRDALKQEDAVESTTPKQTWGTKMDGVNAAGNIFKSISPMELFRRRDLTTERLVDLIADDCYYVVITAIDYEALARGERKVLWRTKLSTGTRSVALAEAVPAMIRSGAPFIGCEMAEPKVIMKGSR